MGGHGLTMAMHLLHQLKSARRFTDLLINKYDLLIKEIQCLQPINLQLKVAGTKDGGGGNGICLSSCADTEN